MVWIGGDLRSEMQCTRSSRSVVKRTFEDLFQQTTHDALLHVGAMIFHVQEYWIADEKGKMRSSRGKVGVATHGESTNAWLSMATRISRNGMGTVSVWPW